MVVGTLFPNEQQEPASALIPRVIPKGVPAVPLLMNITIRRELLAGRAYILTYGKITFSDVFGGDHWITFCAASPRAAMQYSDAKECVEYNDTDSNEVP